MSEPHTIDPVTTLGQVSLFSELDDDELRKLAGIVKIRSYDRKETIFREKDAYRGFYVVADGLVLVYKLSIEGRMLVLHIRRRGEAFADVPLFAGGSYPAWAQAARPSNLLFFPKESFEGFLETHPGICRKMLVVFARRLRELNSQLEQLTLHEVSGRIARYLLTELQRQGHPDPLQPFVRLAVSKGSLAAHLGTTIETLSRTLRRLADDGILRIRGNKISILDLPRLREYGR